MEMKNKRDNVIDIIKGISIISIVFGHAKYGILFFGSYFQVIAFYYVGGLTFKEKSTKDFSKNILFRHYITFVIANIIGICLGYIISKFTLYKFCGKTLVNCVLHILSFDLCFDLMGSAWFLFPFL